MVLARRGPFSAIAASVRMSLRTPGPVAVLFLITFVGAMVLGSPIGALRGAAHAYPVVTHALDLVGELVESVVTLPAIAGSAYLYVRLEAWSRLVAADAALENPVAGPRGEGPAQGSA